MFGSITNDFFLKFPNLRFFIGELNYELEGYFENMDFIASVSMAQLEGFMMSNTKIGGSIMFSNPSYRLPSTLRFLDFNSTYFEYVNFAMFTEAYNLEQLDLSSMQSLTGTIDWNIIGDLSHHSLTSFRSTVRRKFQDMLIFHQCQTQLRLNWIKILNVIQTFIYVEQVLHQQDLAVNVQDKVSNYDYLPIICVW